MVRNLKVLEGGSVDSDTVLDCLLTGDHSGNYSATYDVAENRSFDANLVDLSDEGLEINLTVKLHRGSICNIHVASVCLGGKKKKVSINTVHVEGNTYSRTKMAGINLGDGSLFFLGTSDVPNGSHGSDTRQDGRITNLSAGSKSEVSPALLIKDNDVNASHGAAVGAYDPAALYYLMSRGLTESESRRLITIGSLIPIIDSISDKGLADEARKSLEEVKI